MNKKRLKGRNIFLFILMIPLIGGLFFSGYRSSAREKSAAQTEVMALNASQKAATAEEWEKFRSQTELRNSDNEALITELNELLEKLKKASDAPVRKRVTNLEEQIKYMKARLEAFEKSQSNWESFERKFNYEMDAIGTELKELTADIENNNETSLVRTGEQTVIQ
jgi:uncharacterized protein YeaO (DUF488 family)